ncbi:uncharacterized protein LOC111332593 [Stylophora pistillata]|uniref:uncharacterized protein LOC111332593 n=1 Tax=Stylophora pistillata TaxID=50429 RepID=UPI000C03FD18|nr:uncharacterized protein LOC111332593 [Stylophora pistillata]
MARKERVRLFCQALLKLQGVLLLLNLGSGFIVGQQTYIINTTSAEMAMEGRSSVTTGTMKTRIFHGPNDGIWNYSVAEFNITNGSMANEIFHKKNKISILGTNALSVIVQGNFTVGTDLDVSGQEVNFTSNDKQLFWLGGFVRMNKTCCTLGAGPGGAFSYHGGGHGGRGGGFYQDRNTTRLYGWTYFDTTYLLGGSTGTNLFTSKSGSGGGAIELIANDGTLTLNAAIKADGYSSGNTSDDHCAGGSSGGLIRLQGDRVVIGKDGSLSAVGGDSGFSSNHSYRCGGGGGGGVIQVFSLTDIKNYTANSSTRTSGGRGLQGGEAGREQVALYFDHRLDLKINTTSCKMTWDGNYKYDGAIEGPKTFMKNDYEVCKIEFSSTIFIGRQVSVRISGKRALSLISTHGSIEIHSHININGSDDPYESLAGTRIGGYAKASHDGEHAGSAGPNCSSDGLYGRDFESLLGGSVCLSPGNHSEAFRAVGGGALELRAESEAIVIDATISANGFSNNAD